MLKILVGDMIEVGCVWRQVLAMFLARQAFVLVCYVFGSSSIRPD